ncbi:uncharacterized protein BJX67DRAFT_3348 [Aspergillus lucknowensis]|uniref:Secreted protein n=1 Tax=Aspergillus lucknowensis TaxID=176173 RepID=A0ABR4M6T8_9EURO
MRRLWCSLYFGPLARPMRDEDDGGEETLLMSTGVCDFLPACLGNVHFQYCRHLPHGPSMFRDFPTSTTRARWCGIVGGGH